MKKSICLSVIALFLLIAIISGMMIYKNAEFLFYSVEQENYELFDSLKKETGKEIVYVDRYVNK